MSEPKPEHKNEHPPGIEVGSEFKHYSSNGMDHEWQELPPYKAFTNAFVFAPGKVRRDVQPLHRYPCLIMIRYY
jgi:hypothetical protein